MNLYFVNGPEVRRPVDNEPYNTYAVFAADEASATALIEKGHPEFPVGSVELVKEYPQDNSEPYIVSSLFVRPVRR